MKLKKHEREKKSESGDKKEPSELIIPEEFVKEED